MSSQLNPVTFFDDQLIKNQVMSALWKIKPLTISTFADTLIKGFKTVGVPVTSTVHELFATLSLDVVTITTVAASAWTSLERKSAHLVTLDFVIAIYGNSECVKPGILTER